MSIVKRNQWAFNDLPALFNDVFTRDLWNWGTENNSSTNTTIPSINVRETNDNFEVEVAAPGMNKKDFKVELDGSLLTITSERQGNHEEKEGERFTRREFSYQIGAQEGRRSHVDHTFDISEAVSMVSAISFSSIVAVASWQLDRTVCSCREGVSLAPVGC